MHLNNESFNFFWGVAFANILATETTRSYLVDDVDATTIDAVISQNTTSLINYDKLSKLIAENFMYLKWTHYDVNVIDFAFGVDELENSKTNPTLKTKYFRFIPRFCPSEKKSKFAYSG